MGGRCAEKLIFKDTSTGAGNDIEVATNIARKMVCDWGMSKKIGPLKKNDTLFKNISTAMFNKKIVIKIYGNNFNTKDGTCIRDYIHVMDLADAHLIALEFLEKEEPKILNLNIGTGHGTSVLELIKTFESGVMPRRPRQSTISLVFGAFKVLPKSFTTIAS